MDLARGGHQGMPVQNDRLLAAPLGQSFQTSAQVNFLGGKKAVVKTTDLAKGRRFAKKERAGGVFADTADLIPYPGSHAPHERKRVIFDGATAEQISSTDNGHMHVGEKFAARVRIRIHEDQPIPRGSLGPAIAGASDLVDGFEHHGGAGGAGQFRGAIGGIIVANDEFGFSTHAGEHFHRIPD